MTTRKRDAKEEEDWFEVMGLEWDATADGVNKAYKKLALKLHPDKNRDDPNAADKFDRLKRARDYLLDDDKRNKLSTTLRRHAEASKRRKQEEQARNKTRNAKISALEQREKEARERAESMVGGGGGMTRPTVTVDSIREKTRMERERMSQEAHQRMQEAARAATARARQDADEDDDDMDAGGAKVPYMTSSEIKVKWRKRKRPEPSMSEEDMLWKVFGVFGQIDHIELTGSKGNAGLVKFAERRAAEAAVKTFELDEDMKVYIPADKKHRIFQKAFDPNVATGMVGGASSGPTPASMSTTYNQDFEDLTLRMLRQAAERQKLEKQLREEASAQSSSPTTTTDASPAVPMEGVTPTPPPASAPLVMNGKGSPPPPTSLFGGAGLAGGGGTLFPGGVGRVPPAPQALGGASLGAGARGVENDVLARMRAMSRPQTTQAGP